MAVFVPAQTPDTLLAFLLRFKWIILLNYQISQLQLQDYYANQIQYHDDGIIVTKPTTTTAATVFALDAAVIFGRDVPLHEHHCCIGASRRRHYYKK